MTPDTDAVTGHQPHPAMLGGPNLGLIHPELASKLVKRIFATGIEVAALQALLADGMLSDRAAAIGEQLDNVVRDILTGA